MLLDRDWLKATIEILAGQGLAVIAMGASQEQTRQVMDLQMEIMREANAKRAQLKGADRERSHDRDAEGKSPGEAEGLPG